MQTLEALVLKCPTEVAPSMLEILEVGTTLLKYDPVRLLQALLSAPSNFYITARRITRVETMTTKTLTWRGRRTMKMQTTTLETSESLCLVLSKPRSSPPLAKVLGRRRHFVEGPPRRDEAPLRLHLDPVRPPEHVLPHRLACPHRPLRRPRGDGQGRDLGDVHDSLDANQGVGLESPGQPRGRRRERAPQAQEEQ